MRRPQEVALVLSLAAEGMNQSQIARVVGASRATVRAWLSGAIPDFARHAPMDCLDHVDRLPPDDYVYLLGLYLADGAISTGPRGVHRLRISCADAYPVLMDECESAMAAVLPNKVGRVRSIGCTEVYSYPKHWPCLFRQHGPGRKHTRRIELAAWQQELVDADPRPLLRGLIHSDGCRVLNRAVGTDYPPYPRCHFSNASDDIRRIFGEACDAIGVEWRHNNARTHLGGPAASVAILNSFIGPKT
jgi:Homeodomain-like domain